MLLMPLNMNRRIGPFAIHFLDVLRTFCTELEFDQKIRGNYFDRFFFVVFIKQIRSKSTRSNANIFQFAKHINAEMYFNLEVNDLWGKIQCFRRDGGKMR